MFADINCSIVALSMIVRLRLEIIQFMHMLPVILYGRKEIKLMRLPTISRLAELLEKITLHTTKIVSAKKRNEKLRSWVNLCPLKISKSFLLIENCITRLGSEKVSTLLNLKGFHITNLKDNFHQIKVYPDHKFFFCDNQWSIWIRVFL